MRPATRCSKRWPWRLATGAIMVLPWLADGACATDAMSSPPPKPFVATCDRAATFKTVVDVGHTADVSGALSARGVPEYEFNLRLAREINKALHAAGFGQTVLMITAEAPTAGLFHRAARANALNADLFLAIHHDAVPDRMLETWQYQGQEEHFNDRFPGHSLFISDENADPAGSLAFARLLGNALEAHSLHYTHHYTEAFMGSRRRELLDPQAGVYRYDQLIVLKETRMPAVLLEAGSIVNRDEEIVLATPERQALVAGAVVEAVDAFCTAREAKKQPARSTVARH